MDPFYRDNEFKALELVKGDYTFVKAFDADPALLSQAHQVLRFDGVDTISDIYLNGMWIGSTMDMHTAYEFDVRGLLLESGNELKVCIKSPTRWIAQRDKEHHLGGSIEAMKGFSYLRKAHCMFGWDWGPRLPDEGIWKEAGTGARDCLMKVSGRMSPSLAGMMRESRMCAFTRIICWRMAVRRWALRSMLRRQRRAGCVCS